MYVLFCVCSTERKPETVHDLKAKKDGITVSKDHFCNLRVLLHGGCTYFHEYLRKNENILGYYFMGQVLLIHAKTKHQKSHATVPFNSAV